MQNVVLLNLVHSLATPFGFPRVSPALLSFFDGHVFLLHPFVLCKTYTHYIFTPASRIPNTIILDFQRYVPRPLLFLIPSSSRSFLVHIQSSLHPLISPSPSLPPSSCRPCFTPQSPAVNVSHEHEHILQVHTVDDLIVITCRIRCPVSCSFSAVTVSVTNFMQATH